MLCLRQRWKCVTLVKIIHCCEMVIDASNVSDHILGQIIVIPFPNYLTIVPSATFCTMNKRWAMSLCMKESTMSIARVKFRVNGIRFFFGPFGIATHQTCTRPCPNLKTSLVTKSWPNGWDWRPQASQTNFTRLVDACIRMLERDNKFKK
jgi:hypothetical protein